MHLLKYYVKRCIALPGDTMGIKQGHYYVKGIDGLIGNVDAQERIARLNIVGVATRIWKSVDKYTDEVRWDRVMKKIE